MMKPLRLSSLPMIAHGAHEPLVVGRQQAELGQQQDAGVELVVVERAGERAAAARSRPASGSRRAAVGLARANARPGRRGPGARRCAPADRTPPSTWSPNGCGRAARPRYSHGPASGSSAKRRACTPSGSRRRNRAASPMRGSRSSMNICEARENDAAVGVVLQLLGRLVADPHRPACPESRPDRRRCAPRAARPARCRRPGRSGPLGLDGDVGDVVDVFFHRLGGAEPVQRLDDEEGVAQPAVAVVPGALRARRLGNRGGMRGDDGAGLLEIAELERDRGADDRRPATRAGRRASAPSRANSRACAPGIRARRCRRPPRRARPGPGSA